TRGCSLLSVVDFKMGCFGSKDKLSKEDMDFLKSHTRYDEATIKEWYKGFKIQATNRCFLTLQQDCPNGRLTPAKFVDMYKMFFPSGNAEEFCDHVFRTFDMDKNGYIDFKRKSLKDPKKHSSIGGQIIRKSKKRLSKKRSKNLKIQEEIVEKSLSIEKEFKESKRRFYRWTDNLKNRIKKKEGTENLNLRT
ncbi:unnamed protein product, partial [Heterotrigona itama]